MSRGWSKAEVRTLEPVTYPHPVVAAYRRRSSGHLLLHHKVVGRKSRYFRTSGRWTLWLDGVHLATKAYWGTSMSTPPRRWAEEWIRRIDSEDLHSA